MQGRNLHIARDNRGLAQTNLLVVKFVDGMNPHIRNSRRFSKYQRGIAVGLISRWRSSSS